jgi:hypothetical protein
LNPQIKMPNPSLMPSSFLSVLLGYVLLTLGIDWLEHPRPYSWTTPRSDPLEGGVMAVLGFLLISAAIVAVAVL